jgi:hypothetical protein
MSSVSPPLAIVRSPGTALRAHTPSREVQELWFGLARLHWTSLVLVPADEGESAAALATSLAEVGRRLRDAPVTFMILADPIDYASAGKVIAAVASSRRNGNAPPLEPSGRVIAAIQPVVVEPLGLAVTEAADAVVLCIELGHTGLAAARRTIELVGRDRIVGCVTVQSRARPKTS